MTEEVFAGGWTATKLRARTVQERHNIWKNARTKATPEAMRLVQVIEALGLPYSEDACLTNDDPITIKMYEIINSPEGRAACLKAASAGLPAIAGVDGMLNEALGVDYRGGNMATVTAGSLVGELMRSLGYKKVGQKPMPPGSVAKSASLWVPASSLPRRGDVP